jgi:hypothetical protein
MARAAQAETRGLRKKVPDKRQPEESSAVQRKAQEGQEKGRRKMSVGCPCWASNESAKNFQLESVDEKA